MSRTEPGGAAAELDRLVPLAQIEQGLSEDGMTFRTVRAEGNGSASAPSSSDGERW